MTPKRVILASNGNQDRRPAHEIVRECGGVSVLGPPHVVNDAVCFKHARVCAVVDKFIQVGIKHIRHPDELTRHEALFRRFDVDREDDLVSQVIVPTALPTGRPSKLTVDIAPVAARCDSHRLFHITKGVRVLNGFFVQQL